LKASLPAKPATAPELPPVEAQPREAPKGPARAVVRVERAGRGGKVVTVVEHLGLNPMELEKWLKDLKAGLGCGGVVDGGTLVLQGTHRERLVNLLAARGVKKVTIGS
jgi:translation initiation factor 1